MTFTVLFSAYSHGSARVRGGLSYHLICNAMAIREAADGIGHRICLASTPEEDAPGLWDRARRVFPADDIFVLDDEDAAFANAAAQALEQSERLVIHVQGTRQLRAVAPLRRAHPQRVRIVYTAHSFRNASWKRVPYCLILQRELLRDADYTIFLSPAAIGEFVGVDRLLAAGKAGLIPLGVASWPEWENNTPQDGDVDASLIAMLSHPDRFRFVYFSAFKPGKGHEWLMRSAVPVLREHGHVQLILGGWGDEDIRSNVRRIAGEAKVGRQVCLPGGVRRDLVPWVLKHCHCAVMPSRSETFGQAIAEAMNAGLPVIGTRKGIGAQVIMDGITGFGVEYERVHPLSATMRRVVADARGISMMGTKAHSVVHSMFDWSAIAHAHLVRYEILIDGG